MEHCTEKDRDLVHSDIATYGCHIVWIEDTDNVPAFAFTIGLNQNYQHPEIIIFGLKMEVMHSMLNIACSAIKDGLCFEPDTDYQSFLSGHPVRFLKVNQDFYYDYVGYAMWYYHSSDFPLLQLVWPDKSKRFPWETSFNPDWKFKQPLLDRNLDFKFYEERNCGVFTTKGVFDGDAIIYVTHNIDRDWQFHASGTPRIEEAMFVCLDDIVKLDPTVNELFDLEPGWCAWRENANEKWRREVLVEGNEPAK